MFERVLNTTLFYGVIKNLQILSSSHNKQIFHAFLFNIRNYSPELINIQLREAELNMILSRVSNFDIKQKKAWNISLLYAIDTK